LQARRSPAGNLLGGRGRGFHQCLEILDGGRIAIAAMGVGLAQGAYDLAFAYAKERQQFGKPIAQFQAIQFQLADIAVEIEAGRALTYKAAWLKDQGRPFAKEAAMAKLFTGELSHRAVNHALQIHGGYGFTEEFAISRFYRDQKVLEIGEGTNEVQRMGIARHLGLGRFKKASGGGCSLPAMLLRQFVDDDLGCASYLIGDEEAGEAVLVDPVYAVAPLLAEAEQAGVRVARVLETHTHADHLSGHGRLALE